MRLLNAPAIVLIAFHSLVCNAQDDPNTVRFNIAKVRNINIGKEMASWQATYDAPSGSAKFIINVELPINAKVHPVSISKGSFKRVEGSKPSALLIALKKALEAKRIPVPLEKLNELNFDVAILENNSTLEQNLDFYGRDGGWIKTKIFLSNDEAEVYLNLNPSQGVGEFSIKDEEYGDRVLQELAKIF